MYDSFLNSIFNQLASKSCSLFAIFYSHCHSQVQTSKYFHPNCNKHLLKCTLFFHLIHLIHHLITEKRFIVPQQTSQSPKTSSTCHLRSSIIQSLPINTFSSLTHSYLAFCSSQTRLFKHILKLLECFLSIFIMPFLSPQPSA